MLCGFCVVSKAFLEAFFRSNSYFFECSGLDEEHCAMFARPGNSIAFARSRYGFGKTCFGTRYTRLWSAKMRKFYSLTWICSSKGSRQTGVCCVSLLSVFHSIVELSVFSPTVWIIWIEEPCFHPFPSCLGQGLWSPRLWLGTTRLSESGCVCVCEVANLIR